MALNHQSSLNGDRFPSGIESLLASYREVVSGPEPSANFMPELWARIEGHQPASYRFTRFARGFVTLAGGLCLVLSIALWVPARITTTPASTYVDVLADDSADDAPGDSA